MRRGKKEYSAYKQTNGTEVAVMYAEQMLPLHYVGRDMNVFSPPPFQCEDYENSLGLTVSDAQTLKMKKHRTVQDAKKQKEKDFIPF